LLDWLSNVTIPKQGEYFKGFGAKHHRLPRHATSRDVATGIPAEFFVVKLPLTGYAQTTLTSATNTDGR